MKLYRWIDSSVDYPLLYKQLWQAVNVNDNVCIGEAGEVYIYNKRSTKKNNTKHYMWLNSGFVDQVNKNDEGVIDSVERAIGMVDDYLRFSGWVAAAGL